MGGFDIDNPDSVEWVSDWIELQISTNIEGISKCELKSLLERYKGTDVDDSFVSDVWSELKARQNIYGDNPPFIVERRNILGKMTWNEMPEYTACLWFSLYGNDDNPVSDGKLFERITDKAIKKFIDGNAIIFGHPSRLTVENICKTINEKFICEPSENFKDRGLDVIAWKPFGDGRPNQVIFLLQCACGLNWRAKTNTLPTDAWCQYIHWACNPIKGFCVPKIFTRKREFHDISKEAGLLIDRARIFRNISSLGASDDLKDELKTWCETKLVGIGAL